MRQRIDRETDSQGQVRHSTNSLANLATCCYGCVFPTAFSTCSTTGVEADAQLLFTKSACH